MIFEYYEKVKLEIIQQKNDLLKEQQFTITFDEWTSVSQKSLMNVNIHFQAKSFNLGITEVNQVKCTSEVLLEMIEKKLKEFGLDLSTQPIKKIITADGAATNIKLSRISNIFIQNCQNHGLNLAICDTFYTECFDNESEDEIEEDSDCTDSDNSNASDADRECFMALKINFQASIKKARMFLKKIKNSPKLRRILKKYTELTPITDVKTRWSSLASMTNRFIEILPAVKKTFIDADVDFNWSENDTLAISTISKLLTPVKAVVEALSKDKANLLAADIELSNLIRNLESISDVDKAVKEEFISNIKSRFLGRRTIISDILQFLCSSKQNPERNMFYQRPTIAKFKEVFEMFCLTELNVSESDENEKNDDFDIFTLV